MTEINAENDFSGVSWRSWVIHGSGHNDITNIQKEVDRLFSKRYSSYPECDWGRYGFRPPEKYQLMGAWRHPDLKAFIFLMDNPSVKKNRTVCTASSLCWWEG